LRRKCVQEKKPFRQEKANIRKIKQEGGERAKGYGRFASQWGRNITGFQTKTTRGPRRGARGPAYRPKVGKGEYGRTMWGEKKRKTHQPQGKMMLEQLKLGTQSS